MSAFQLAMMILGAILAQRGNSGGTTQAVSDAVTKLTDLYRKLREAAAQSSELTESQELALDAYEESVFASAAADPDKNK